MPTIPDNNGTVTVYVVSGLNPTIAIGGNNIPLFFGGTKSATQSLVININWGSISTLGGQLYAEYKTSAGVVYRSGSVAITKSATMSGGGTPQAPADAPNPANIANSLCCNQTIRLGDKPALINGSQYANPYKNEPYGINSLWLTNGNGSVRFNNLDPATQVLDIDYVTGPGNFTITRSLGYNSDKTLSNKSNTITITVVPSPIINEILIDGGKDTNGFVEIVDSNPKQIYSERTSSIVNLNILENPYHTPSRGDSFTNIDRYTWQYTISDYSENLLFKNWTTIENENSAILEYSALKKISDFENKYIAIRRIAYYKNISNASNIIKIVPRTLKNNNVICCDQVLALDSNLKQIENPSTITGSKANIEDIEGAQIATTDYQWQSQAITNSRPNQYGAWSDIFGATSKDYLPAPLKFTIGTRGDLVVETTYNYRRITTINYRINHTGYYTSKSYSNEINIKTGRAYGAPTLIAYPNPASSIINIENKSPDYLLSNTKITVANIMGATVISNFSIINENLVSIDVSNLVIGTYFINIEGITGGIRGGDGKSQLTFLKSN